MKILDLITDFEIKNAGDLVMSDDFDSDTKLPQQLGHKKFHNNVYLRILQLTNNMLDCTDEQKRKTLKLDTLDLINEYSMLLRDTISDLKSYGNILNSVYAIEHGSKSIVPEIGNEENVIAFDNFYTKNENSDILDYTLNRILVHSNNMDYDFEFGGARGQYEKLLDSLEEFKQSYPVSDDDAMLLYYRLNVQLQETLSTMWDLIQNTHNPENKHRCLYINKDNFRGLIKSCQHNHYVHLERLKDSQDIKTSAEKYDKFYNETLQYLKRQQYTKGETFSMSTRELENMFFSIGANTPYNMTPFVQFLLDNQIKLPLSSYKSEISPLYLLDYHNDTISKAFVIENTNSMYNMDEMRADYFDNDTLFHKNMTAIKLQPKAQTM